MVYSKEAIIEKIKEALKNPSTLYTCDFINYFGTVGDERYTEIAARELSQPQNLSLLCSIPTITREKPYKTKSHNELGLQGKSENSNRDEEWVAKGLYGKTFNSIGKIIDFQTPLKNIATDKAGKIDLLSHNKNEHTAYILELKKPTSEETLLRCVLEAYTYWKIADRKKLLCNFGIKNAQLRKAVLIFKSCAAYGDFRDNKCEATSSLMGKLGVDLFVLNEDKSNVIESYKN